MIALPGTTKTFFNKLQDLNLAQLNVGLNGFSQSGLLNGLGIEKTINRLTDLSFHNVSVFVFCYNLLQSAKLSYRMATELTCSKIE